MISLEYILLIIAVLIILSIVITRFTHNLGTPTLLIFLAIGIAAGSEGIGNLYFDDVEIAQSVGILALIIILFTGGLNTKWNFVKGQIRNALALSTIGVFLTAVLLAGFLYLVLDFDPLICLLIGALISSTDAAAVFSILGSQSIKIKGEISPLLELESGSNDPMAIFLTIGTIQLITSPEAGFLSILSLFFMQMSVGFVFGLGLGYLLVLFINRFKFIYEGFYPVFLLASAYFVYSLTASIEGSGFLAVYIAGLMLGKNDFIHKKSSLRFFDGLAWLSQICMFIVLGLLVFPSELIPVIGVGLLVSAFLIFVARPLGVFLTLMFSKFKTKEKIFISWVGLRGSIPIVLATFPMVAGVEKSDTIFNLIFFIVITSVIIQGWSIPKVAKFLGLASADDVQIRSPFEFEPLKRTNRILEDFFVPFGSTVSGKKLVDLNLPENALVVVICREEEFLLPRGDTQIFEGDILQVLTDKDSLKEVYEKLK